LALNDKEILSLLKEGSLVLEPTDEGLLQPSSIDLRLHTFARRYRHDVTEVDTRWTQTELARAFQDISIDENGYLLAPQEVLFVQTFEYMKIPEICQGLIAQRSSLMRVGLHVSSSLVNPGYEGNLPCMLANFSSRPIRLYPGIPFCQLVLLPLSDRPSRVYGEKQDAKYHKELGEDVQRWASIGIRLADPEKAKDFEVKASFGEDQDAKVR
jgi:dCTP deaminase